jgi:MGT family glycosyltransferase
VTVPRRFLFTSWPFPGHLFPLMALAYELRQRGHECAFYTGTRVAEVVRAEGFTCFPFTHVDEAGVLDLMSARPREPWRASNIPAMMRLLRAWLIQTVPDQIRDLEAVCAEWRPEVIGTDPTLWAPMVVLHEKLSIPVAICSFIPACTLPGEDVPRFGPGLPRTHRRQPSRWDKAFRVLGRLSTAVSRRTINRIRSTHGLPAIQIAPSELVGRMPLYLIPASRGFDYDRHDVPATVHYVGPYVWNRPQSQAPTPWLADLRRDIPCVHVTEGTVHVQRPFVLDAAFKGLAGLSLTVVATTGVNRSAVELGFDEVPANVRIEAWVSHADLLPLTDVMVTTGGAGSVLAALAAGVPLVIVPTEWDKPEIAQRVVEAGAGVRIAPQECTPERMRAAVMQVLQDPSFKTSARRLAREFGDLSGAPRAADLLEGLAAQ